MNWRLIAVDISVLVFPILNEMLMLLNPLRSRLIYTYQRPMSLWLVLTDLGLYSVLLLIYPVLFFVVIYFLARHIRVRKWATVGSLAVFSLMAQAFTPFARQILMTSSALREPWTLWDLVAPTLPIVILDGFVYEFLLALGAVSFPRLMAEWKSSRGS